MELDDELKAELIATARSLKGSERRIFMARTVKMLGPGGQRLAERELGWNRATIRKGMRELESGVICLDGAHLRGRKPLEERLPHLLRDIRDLIETWRRAHPECRNDARAPCMSAEEVRRALIEQKGYSDSDSPLAANHRRPHARTRVSPASLDPLPAAPTRPTVASWDAQKV
jgi:predicted transcriptional regulator